MTQHKSQVRGWLPLSAMITMACSVSTAPNPGGPSSVPPPPPPCLASGAPVAETEKTPAPAPTTNATAQVKYPPLALEGTELRVIHSDLTGKDHQLIIGLPPSFAKEPSRRYPVLYLLDGQWDFPLIHMLSGGLRYDQNMPEMLIVGLSYAGTAPDYETLRADDYIPTRAKDHESKVIGGGGPKFLEFLETVAIPLAEREYRADSTKRVLSGSSYGGLFVLYALFEKPDLFQAYASISPAAGWDNFYLARREREFRKTHPKLERRLWLSIGDSEWPGFVKDAQSLFHQIEASRYQGISLQTHTVKGERHAGVKPEAYNRAMRFATAPWLPPAGK